MPTLFDRNEAPAFPHDISSQQEANIENKLLGKTKIEFAACMNESHVETLVTSHLYLLLKHMSHPLRGSKLNFTELADFIIDYDANLLIQTVVNRDFDDPKQQAIYITRGLIILNLNTWYKDNPTNFEFVNC
jgi:predicted metalloendopeptidase